MEFEELANVVGPHFEKSPEWQGIDTVCQGILPRLGRKRVTKKLLAELRNALDVLVFEGMLVWRVQSGDGGAQYAAREPLFRDARFLVNLTEDERAGRFLVPGHRFVPFVGAGVFPGEVTLFYNGIELATCVREFKGAEVMIFLSVLGHVRMMEYLNVENDVAKLMFESGDDLSNATVDVTVFDLGPVFCADADAQSLSMRVLDVANGVVELETVSCQPATRGDAACARDGIAALDRAFKLLFDRWLPNGLGIEAQIACAYAAMPGSFLSDPPFHFGGYLALSERVAFAVGPLDTTLWHQGEDPVDCMADREGELLHGRTIVSLGLMVREAVTEEMWDDDDEGGWLDDDMSLAALGEGSVADAGPQPLLFPVEQVVGARSRAGARPAPAKQHASGLATGSNDVFVFKVALDGAKRIYRRIEVHADNTWEEFHDAIFVAFDRFDEHLFAFYLTGKATKSWHRRIGAPSIESPTGLDDYSEAADAATTLIRQAGLHAKMKLYYLFDFGDSWWHEVTLERIEERPGADPATFPCIAKKAGESPPQYG